MEYSKLEEYYSIIEMCYKEDSVLIERWHIISGNSVQDCAKDTEQVLKKDNSEFFIVEENNELIGYFGQTDIPNINYLSTIFVRPKYRKREYMSKFWSLINEHFAYQPFMTGVYTKNLPAVEFFRKHANMEENKTIDNKDVSIFGFNMSKLGV